jgi:hypothetical protein
MGQSLSGPYLAATCVGGVLLVHLLPADQTTAAA